MMVSINGGTPKWLVHFMENPIKMDDNWEYLYFWKPPNGSTRLISLIRLEVPVFAQDPDANAAISRSILGAEMGKPSHALNGTADASIRHEYFYLSSS